MSEPPSTSPARSATLATALVLGCLGVAPLGANGPGKNAGEPVASFEEATSVSWVFVPVMVGAAAGGRRDAVAPAELSREDFRLLVDEVPVRFEDFVSPHENPQTLLFFQDLSGSMANGGKLETSQAVVRWFLHRSPEADEMSLTTFASGKTFVEVPITSERAALEAHVEGWRAYGTTALHDALAWIPEVRLRARSAPSVILLTDGVDNASVIPAEKAREMVRAAEVPVYVVALRRPGRVVPGPRSPGEPWRYGDLLRRLAAATGGLYLEARRVEDVDRVCSIIAGALRSRYALGFQLAGGGEERYRAIRVETPGRRLGLRHRAGYRGSAPE